MAKYNRNSGKPWSQADVTRLTKLAKEDTPTRVIGLKLGERYADRILSAEPGCSNVAA
jgi:hypothetical protein